MKVYYESDADVGLVKGKRILVVGYGSQGRAHALNLKDSGVGEVLVGLQEGSATAKKVVADGFEVKGVKEGAKEADVVVMLAPDERQADIYRESLEGFMKEGSALMFAHGFNVHFGLIEARGDLDVLMVAPKGPGHTVRGEYERGGGVPCLLAVERDATGKAHDLGLSYAAAIGGCRAGVIATSFKEECETDLFGEQAVLCGGLVSLVHAAFETLTEAGYSEEMAYFECLHEIKLIVDLMYEGGIANMFYSVSNTAEYGAYVSGPRVIDAGVKRRMKGLLRDIQEGRFARDWTLENKASWASFKALRAKNAAHAVEGVGERLRGMMPWLSEGRLVDKEKN